MRGRSRFRPNRYRALVHEVEVLQAERRRLELLLGEACRYGAHHTGCSWKTLLGVFAETHGCNLARPAWVEERDRETLDELRTAAVA